MAPENGFVRSLEERGGMATYINNAWGGNRHTVTATPGRSDDAEGVYCDDCCKNQAKKQFLHLTKGEFSLCDDCWLSADHEEDYLENCSCACPTYVVSGEEVNCDECSRKVQYLSHCDCPISSILPEAPNNCVFCKGVVMPYVDKDAEK
jgi:hypothetical protein